jgi:hypothetical protein
MRIAALVALMLTQCAEPPSLISREESAEIARLDAAPRVDHGPPLPPRLSVDGADTPDHVFGGGRILAIRSGEELELVPQARSADDRSGDFPFTRVDSE